MIGSEGTCARHYSAVLHAANLAEKALSQLLCGTIVAIAAATLQTDCTRTEAHLSIIVLLITLLRLLGSGK